MKKSTVALLFTDLAAREQLAITLILAVLLVVIYCQLAEQKQAKHNRDTSLDQYIVNEYKKMLFYRAKYPFNRRFRHRNKSR